MGRTPLAPWDRLAHLDRWAALEVLAEEEEEDMGSPLTEAGLSPTYPLNSSSAIPTARTKATAAVADMEGVHVAEGVYLAEASVSGI